MSAFFRACILGLVLTQSLTAAQALPRAKSCRQVVLLSDQSSSKPASKEAAPQSTPESQWLEYVSKVSDLAQQRAGYIDPFINAPDVEGKTRILDSLSFQPDPDKPGSREPSILGRTRHFMFSEEASQQSLDGGKSMLEEFGRAAEEILKQESPKRADLYRLALSAELLKSYLVSLKPQSEVDRDGKPKDESEDKEEKQEKEENEKQDPDKSKSEESEPDDSWQDLPKDYDPHTKDSESNPEVSEKRQPPKKRKVLIYNSDTAYFVMTRFNSVLRKGANRFRGGEIPMLETTKIGTYQLTSRKVDLQLKADEVSSWRTLPLPPGYVPLKSQDGSVELRMDEAGNYEFRTQLQKSTVQLAVEKQDLNPIQIEYLKKPVGVLENEWPEEMRSVLFQDIKGKSPPEAASYVMDYIRKTYLYSVDARAETDPIAALKAGAFQCDMAAMIMVAILRDYLGLPARAVSAYVAFGNKIESHLMMPGEGHALVQLYHNGKWYTYDPTPKTKDKNKEKDGSNQNTPQPKQQEFEDHYEKKHKEEKSKKDEKQKAERAEKSSESKKEDDSKESEDSKDSTESSGSQAKASQATPTPELSDEEKAELREALQKEAEFGSLSLKNGSPPPHLIERAVRVALRTIMMPERNTSKALEELLTLKNDLKMSPHPAISKLLDEAERALQYKQESVSEALLRISVSIKTEPLVTTYNRILQIKDRLEVISSLLDGQTKPQELVTAIRNLEQILREFRKLAPADAEQIAVIRKFMGELPLHARRVFMQKYKITDVNKDPGVRQAFQDLESGKLQHLNLVRLVYPLTEFIHDPIPTPAYKDVETYVESRRRAGPRRYVPLEDLGRADNAIFTDPLKTVQESVRDGSAYLPIRRRTVNVKSTTGGITDPRRVTIAGFDTSGSMSGDPAEFQAALLAAFSDRALSDIKDGVHRHIMAILGFGDNVHTEVPVRNSAEAIALLEDFPKILKNTGSGTDTNKFFERAFAIIEDAQKKNGEPLAMANIVLLTDAKDTVLDYDHMKRLRQAINRKTPVNILVVALDGSNKELRKFVTSINGDDFKETLYREIDKDRLNKYMSSSREAPTVDVERDFHTDKKAESLTAIPSIIQLLDHTSTLVERAQNLMDQQFLPQGLSYWLSDFERIGRQNYQIPPNEKSKIVSAFQFLRGHLYSSETYNNSRIRSQVVEDILRNIEKLLGKPKSQYDVNEVGAVVNMIKASQAKGTK